MNPNQGQPAQQAPRLPNITPQVFEMVHALDGAIAKAPLARDEHQKLFGYLQQVTLHIEGLEGKVRELTKALEQQNTPPPATEYSGEETVVEKVARETAQKQRPA